MTRQDYLAYLARLYDRANEEVKRSGITRWVLIGAGGFALNALASLAEPIGENSLIAPVLVTSVYLQHITLLGLAGVIFLDPSTSTKHAKIRARISYTTARDLFEFLMIFFPVTALTVYQIFAQDPRIARLIGPAFKPLEGLFLLLAIFLIGSTLTAHFQIRKHGFPKPSVPAAAVDTFFIEAPMALAAFGLAGQQVYELGTILQMMQISFLTELLKTAAYAVLLFWCLFLLFHSRSREARLAVIQAIEHDVVLNELPDDEIARRIRLELTGQEVGRWFHDRLAELQALRADVGKLAEGLEPLDTELSGIDATYSHERAARYNAFAENFQTKAREFHAAAAKIASWISASTLIAKRSTELTALFAENTAETTRLKDAVSAELNRLDKIRTKFGIPEKQ